MINNVFLIIYLIAKFNYLFLDESLKYAFVNECTINFVITPLEIFNTLLIMGKYIEEKNTKIIHF